MDLRVFLEGPARYNIAKGNSDGLMLSDIQGWLPDECPYDPTIVYDEITNPESPLGKIIDWVLVEIWEVDEATRKYTVEESKPFLLKNDGRVVDMGGSSPEFAVPDDAEDKDLRIVVKHRNHMPVISQNVTADIIAGAVIYNFTDELPKAFGFPGNSNPMVDVGGKWCMWGGDLNSDGIIDADDAALFKHGVVHGATTPGYGNLSDFSFSGATEAEDKALFRTNLRGTKSSPVLLFKQR
jgi:hypothetical protein